MVETIGLLTASEAFQLPTGYATVMKNLVPFLLRKGYDIHHMAWQHIGDPIRVSPNGKDLIYQCSCGDKPMTDPEFPGYLERWIKKYDPDAIFSLIDLWFTEKLISESSRAKVPYINYFPQDFSPFYKDWIELIRVCHTPLAMSNFGRDVVLKAVRGAKGGWTRHFDMDVLYHGVDPNIYKPMTKAQRTDIRYQLTKGHPDAFLFGIVGKNTDRKQHPRAMQAYKMFKAMNPNSESRLLMKVGDPVSLSFSGHDLYIYARDLGILNDVIWLDTQNDFIAGVEDHIMAKYYGAMDIYLSATSGEGFGLPTMEAMACGTPVCITDYTTSRELTQGSGYLAGVKTMVTAGMFNANRAMVDIEHLANLMSEAYNDDKQRKIKGKKALKISQKFHWKDLANKADEIIKESISVGY